MSEWARLPRSALEELAGFPAALLPDLPVPVIFEAGGRRFASHETHGRPGLRVSPATWLRVLTDAGRPGATVAELADLYGGRLRRAWWPAEAAEWMRAA